MRAIAAVSTTLLLVSVLAGLSGCSRENQHWRSAQAADSLESYDRFLELHPDGDLAAQAKRRIEQLKEERDWQRASTSDTLDAYRRFLAKHPEGKWTQEARIRLDAFSLDDPSSNQTSSREEFTVRRLGGPATIDDRASAPVAGGSSDTQPDVNSDIAQPAEPAIARSEPSDTPVESTHSVLTDNQAPSSEEPSVRPASAPAPAPTTVSDISPPPPPPDASPSAESFGIQLGAFSSEDKANDEWRRLTGIYSDELGALEPHVVPTTTESGALFRLQSHVGDEQFARAICASLIEKSQGCVVVLPHR